MAPIDAFEDMTPSSQTPTTSPGCSVPRGLSIPGHRGLYVLQLDADGPEAQSDIISRATDAIDSQTTISF